MVSVAYVRAIAWADRSRPSGWRQAVTPVIILTALGLASIPFPQLLGNGRDIAESAFKGTVAPLVLLTTLLLKPLATVMMVRSGAPGGLFTPSLALGAMLGGLVGDGWSLLSPGTPPGLFAMLGAAAVLAATTQGPISTVVLMIEFTGHARSFMAPLLIAVSAATLVSRWIEPRSIYDARLSDEQVSARVAARTPAVT
jgi:H+/Cl- antiporter ClcA